MSVDNSMGMLRVRFLLGGSLILCAGIVRGADKPAPVAPLTFRQYCFQCHAKTPMAGVNLEQMTSQRSVGESFPQWEKVVDVLEQNRMPPKGMPQPDDAER